MNPLHAHPVFDCHVQEISPSQLIELEHNTKSMQDDPQAPIDIFFDQVKDLIKHGELSRYLYSQIQTTNISYTSINRTRKFQDAIKTRKRMNSIQQNWINFRTHFRTAHRELKETGELTMEAAEYHQDNLVNYIVARMSGLSFP